MKYKFLLMTLLLLGLCSPNSTLAQSTEIQKEDLTSLVITMQQGTGTPKFLVTINGNGDIIYQGADVIKTKTRQTERRNLAVDERMVKPERVFKIISKGGLNKEQLKELVSEFYKIDFFSLNHEYRTNKNGVTIFGHNPVITSITINGKTKRVYNYLFAPRELIELQRKIYTISGLGHFVKAPPYWLSNYPGYF